MPDFTPAPENAPVILTGGTFNSMARVAQAFSPKGDMSEPAGGREGVVTIPVENTSGSQLDRFDVVAFGDPMITSGTDLDEFKNKPVFEIGTPSIPGDEGNWGVLLNTLRNGDVGRAAVGGIIPVQIDGDGDYADPVDGSNNLEGTSDGEVRVVWRATGSGVQWGAVRLPGGSGGGGAEGYPIKFMGYNDGDEDWVRCYVAGTISKWTLLADQSGSVTIDIWKDSYTNFPPTDADSMTNGNEPSLSSAQKNEDTSITGWTTTSITAGDIIMFHVDSISGIDNFSLELWVT